MSSAKQLSVYRNNMLVGTLFDNDVIKFSYDKAWQATHADSISPNLPIAESDHSGQNVESYFENLLPEAGIRDLLTLKHQATSTFKLLSVIGGDTASDLTILPEGQLPEPPSYQDITWQDIADSFTQQQGIISNIQSEDGLRISLAGAQKKLSICINDDGNPLLPLGSSPSTYIIKPDIKGVDGVWSSAINETLVMSLAAKLGLGVAEVSYQPIVKACLIKRYDRLMGTDGEITKLHQLDICQLDGKKSTVKYESDGGPTLQRCRALLGKHGVNAADIKRVIQWLFFNLYVGNHDSHAKNLSIYFPANNTIRVTPFYDLLSTSIYPGLSRKFAFNIGHENTPQNINQEQITNMAVSLGFKPKYVLKIAEALANKLLIELEAVSEEVSLMANPGSDRTMVERLKQHISSSTKSFQNRLI
jgi:serine/threonine-protein kinase HipA